MKVDRVTHCFLFQVLLEAVHVDASWEAGQVHEHDGRRVGEQPALLQTQDDEHRLDQGNVGSPRRIPVRIWGLFNNTDL